MKISALPFRQCGIGTLVALMCCSSVAAPRQPTTVARLAPGQSCIPAWPDSAIGQRRGGTTSLLLRVSPDGAVIGAKVTASSGFADLDQATIATATTCRFSPGVRSGVPALSSVVFTHVWARAGSRPVPGASGASRPAARQPCATMAYPPDSLRNGEQGTVHMTFLIDTDGAVLEKHVAKGSGYPDLDRATLDGMAQCRFTPAIANGKPEQSLLSFSYTWTLN